MKHRRITAIVLAVALTIGGSWMAGAAEVTDSVQAAAEERTQTSVETGEPLDLDESTADTADVMGTAAISDETAEQTAEEMVQGTESADEDHGIQTLSMTSFTYTPSYTSLSFSSAGGISASEIRAQAETLITSTEGTYNSVNADDNGALSIGKLQWHGTKALNLLKTIVSMDNTTAYNTLGETLYNEIRTKTDWDSRTLSSSEASVIKTLLGTDNSQTAQDKLADSDVAIYVNQGYNQGIRNAAALVYYADIANQYGTSRVKTIATYAYNVAGKSWSKVTANEMHIAVICRIYAYSYGHHLSSAYVPRQRTQYGKIVALGWAYCNSGDSVIPYNTAVGAAWLQRALNSYQNAGLSITDKYDSATTAAIKTFQKSEGLTQDGSPTAETVSLLIYRLYGATALGDSTVTDVVKISGVWTYTVNGTPNYAYTGFASNSSGKWYVEKGKVTKKINGVYKDTSGAIGTANEWYYVIGNRVQTSFTGLADYRNASGWWYITKGKVDRTVTTVAKNKNGWWYVQNGKVNRGYTGFASNSSGKWYVQKGKVTKKINGVYKDTTGAIGTANEWYYVIGNRVQTSFTGLADYRNASGWWYITKGKVDRTVTTVAKNKNGWWYVKNGKVQRSFTGLADNQNGTWYCKNGKVQKSYTGALTISGQSVYIKNGKLQSFTTPTATLTVLTQSNGSTNVKIQWSSVGAEKYRVFRKTYGGSWKKLADVTGTSYTDTNVSGAYYYTVRCISGDGSAYTSSYTSSYPGYKIISYAEQYVGNPYVWGGESLTSGCDCSGFVMLVYAHFGVYLPHYSYTQAKAGYGVSSLSQAQPGDLVFHKSSGSPSGAHIGLYDSDGQMVNAKGTAYGICITDIDPEVDGLTIRRIF